MPGPPDPGGSADAELVRARCALSRQDEAAGGSRARRRRRPDGDGDAPRCILRGRGRWDRRGVARAGPPAGDRLRCHGRRAAGRAHVAARRRGRSVRGHGAPFEGAGPSAGRHAELGEALLRGVVDGGGPADHRRTGELGPRPGEAACGRLPSALAPRRRMRRRHVEADLVRAHRREPAIPQCGPAPR